MKTRRHERTRLIYRLRVFDGRAGRLLGSLVDIDLDGMKVMADHPMQPDTELLAVLDLPTARAGERRLSLAAVSVWCRPFGGDGHFRIGFRFAGASAEQQAVIRMLERDYFQHDDAADPEADMNPPL